MTGKLDRALEFLPSEEEISERLANGQQTTSTATEIRLVHTWTRPASSSSITTTTPMTATMTKIASHGCSHIFSLSAAFCSAVILSRSLICVSAMNAYTNSATRPAEFMMKSKIPVAGAM